MKISRLLRVAERAVPPLGERKHDYYFFRELAIRLGLENTFPGKLRRIYTTIGSSHWVLPLKKPLEKNMLSTALKPGTYDTINPRAGKQTGFATPSGKCELYSNVLEKLGYDPLPYYEEPPEGYVKTPEVAKEYPLILITGGRFMPQYQAEHRRARDGVKGAAS